jgi:hypothetical protein
MLHEDALQGRGEVVVVDAVETLQVKVNKHKLKHSNRSNRSTHWMIKSPHPAVSIPPRDFPEASVVL